MNKSILDITAVDYNCELVFVRNLMALHSYVENDTLVT